MAGEQLGEWLYGDRGIDWVPVASKREHAEKGGGEYRCLVCETRCGEDGHCRCCLIVELQDERDRAKRVRAAVVEELGNCPFANLGDHLSYTQAFERVLRVVDGVGR